MTPIAIFFLVFALVIVWGGLVGSIILLSRKPEVDAYPAGGDHSDHSDHGGHSDADGAI